jgi:hypothetical protein
MAIAFVNSRCANTYHILRCVSNDPLRCGLAHCGRVFDEEKMNITICDSEMDCTKVPCENCLRLYHRRLKVYEKIARERGWRKSEA